MKFYISMILVVFVLMPLRLKAQSPLLPETSELVYQNGAVAQVRIVDDGPGKFSIQPIDVNNSPSGEALTVIESATGLTAAAMDLATLIPYRDGSQYVEYIVSQMGAIPISALKNMLREWNRRAANMIIMQSNLVQETGSDYRSWQFYQMDAVDPTGVSQQRFRFRLYYNHNSSRQGRQQEYVVLQYFQNESQIDQNYMLYPVRLHLSGTPLVINLPKFSSYSVHEPVLIRLPIETLPSSPTATIEVRPTIGSFPFNREVGIYTNGNLFSGSQ